LYGYIIVNFGTEMLTSKKMLTVMAADSTYLKRICHLRTMSNTVFRNRSDDLSFTGHGERHDRHKSVTSFYNQSAIDAAASKTIVRLVPTTMLYTGKSSDGTHLMRSAQYLHMELPVRIAHRIAGFRGLPFIVGCNPTILAVHEMYIRAFHMLAEFPTINDFDDEAKYSNMLRMLLDEHRDIISMLAEGFRESRKHIRDESMIKNFLDRTLTARLGLRMLAEHHLSLREDKSNFVGIICVNFSPKTLIEKKAEVARHMCEVKYGVAPEVRINGHIHASFPYMPQPLDYILTEILKNACRATIVNNLDRRENLPAVKITFSNNDIDFIIRVSDEGGGIPHADMKKIWDYGFTSAEKDLSDDRINRGIFGEFMENRHQKDMHGYGFGLPASQAFARYLGGDITIESLQGIGTDVFIRLRHIDGKQEGFRI